MARIQLEKQGVNGAPKDLFLEAPLGPKGEAALGYLKPSGATYTHPVMAAQKTLEAAHPHMPAGHLAAGIPRHIAEVNGVEYVSDQRWIYDMAEAATLADDPRFIRVVA